METCSLGLASSTLHCGGAGSLVSWVGWDPSGGTAQPYATPILTGASNAANGVKISWKAVEGAGAYGVYRSGGVSSSLTRIASVTGTSYTDTTALSGTSYQYTVCVLENGKVASGYDRARLSVYRLAMPTVSAVNHANGVKISWNQITGAAGYRIYRKTADSGWKQVAAISGNATVSYVDTSAISGSTCYYAVQAYKGSNTSSFETNRKILYLAQPEVTLSLSSSGVYVSWNEVQGAAGYRIYRKTSGGSWTTLTTVTDGSTFRYEDTSIKNNSGTTYYYTVRAYAGSAQSTYDGSKTIKFLLQPSPVLSNAAAGVKVSWSKINGAANYAVYRKTASTNWTRIATLSSTAASYTDTSIRNNSGTTYYYTVRAISGSAMSTYKTTCSILYLAQPAVTLSMASNGVSVSWNKVEGASSYRVYRKTSGSSWTTLTTVTDGTTFRYTDTSIKNNSGTTYYYTVRAYKGSAQSAFDSSKQIKFLLQPSPALSNAAAGVKVSWNKITGAGGYYVYRKTSTTGWTRIATITSGSTISYTDTAVKSSNGSKYIYTVRAYSGSYMSTYHSGKTILRLTAPTFSSLTNVSTKSMLAKWTKNSKADGYQIQYSTSSGFSGAKTVTVSSNATLSKTVSGLTKGTRYYVRIRSYDKQDSTTYYSAWSNTRNVKISK